VSHGALKTSSTTSFASLTAENKILALEDIYLVQRVNNRTDNKADDNNSEEKAYIDHRMTTMKNRCSQKDQVQDRPNRMT
jgi:predicted AAA+ superfamily ATPase